MAIQKDINPAPLAPSALWQLFFSPSRYFQNIQRLAKRPEVLLVIWLSGLTYAMDRIDQYLVQADLNIRVPADLSTSQSGWQLLGPWLTESWLYYWGFVLGVGVINGLIFWYLGGWWYRKRLNWAGAQDVSPISARLAFVYQDLVAALPVFLITLLQTLIYPNYLEAWDADEYWSSSLVIIFVFWSCVVSYKAARTAFPVKVWGARIWFLILPILLHIVIFGVFGSMYALLDADMT